VAPASNQQACPECRSPQQKGKEEIGDICNVQEKVSDGEEKVSDGEEKVSDGEEKVSDGEEKVSDGEESTDKEKGVGKWANVDDIRLENIDEAKENDGAEMEIFASGVSGDRTGVVACGGLSSSWIIAWQQWICGASFRLIASH